MAHTDALYQLQNKIGIQKNKFNGLNVLEVCAGTGFLTYHLLGVANPKNYWANDISSKEIIFAKRLLRRKERNF